MLSPHLFAAALPAPAQTTPNYSFTHVAGSTSGPGYSDGVGANARFFSPGEVALDRLGNLYVADGNNTVRKITAAGVAIRKGVPAGLPVITTQPASQTAAAGGSVQFAVTASAIPAPAYQWYFNGSPFSGATASTLSITNVRAADAGDYTVVVSNAFGTATSNKAVLTVTATTPPPGNPSGGGGGAPSGWFCAALAVASAARALSGRRV